MGITLASAGWVLALSARQLPAHGLTGQQHFAGFLSSDSGSSPDRTLTPLLTPGLRNGTPTSANYREIRS